MTVKELIKELKKMPQHLDVGYAAHDNSSHEVADWIHNVVLFDKNDIQIPDYVRPSDADCYKWLPDKCVVLRS